MEERSREVRRRFFKPSVADLLHLERLRAELEAHHADNIRRRELGRRAIGRVAWPLYPTSGDPNIIGEHEVAPVRCPCCNEPLPWPLIKGWRD